MLALDQDQSNQNYKIERDPMKKNILKVLLLLVVLIFSEKQASAQLVGYHEPNIKSFFETDKKVYAPGENVYAVLYVENKSSDFIWRPDYSIDPTLTNINVGVNLRAYKVSGLSPDFMILKSRLEDQLSMWIPPNHTRPYSSIVFRLVDKAGKPFPEGIYILSHEGVVFLTGTGDQTKSITVGGDHSIFGMGDNAIEMTGNLSDTIIFVSKSAKK